MPDPHRPRVLFLVEGFTDIRFVVGLSEICDLTMIVPARAYRESQLADRVADSRANLRVIEIPGGRLRFQVQSIRELWRHAPDCELILSQELLRGSLNANIVGRLRRTPVVAYMAISPLEVLPLPAGASADQRGGIVAGRRSHHRARPCQRPADLAMRGAGAIPPRRGVGVV